jgi:LemA protein
MGKMGLVGCLGVLLVVAIIVGIGAMGTYNSLVSKSEAVDGAWAQVENVYQRRADLIPNLVATVQGAANFEKSTLEAVTEARASVGRAQISGKELVNDPQAFARFEAAQGALTSALSRLLVVAENYPDLKATQAFRDLQSQLEGTENRITVERMRFNEAALSYNTARKRFPSNLLANAMGFGEKQYFKAAAGSEKAPQVQFEFGGDKPAPKSSPAPEPAR